MRLTADICDENEKEIEEGSVQILSIPLRMYGKRPHISGEVVTVKAIEDNSLIRKTIEQDGENKILVVDGAGSQKCALMGGALGALAKKNGWQGAIIYGCIRDSQELLQLELGVWAVGTSPLKSKKLNVGLVNTRITIANCSVISGNYCVADSDGVLFSKKNIVD